MAESWCSGGSGDSDDKRVQEWSFWWSRFWITFTPVLKAFHGHSGPRTGSELGPELGPEVSPEVESVVQEVITCPVYYPTLPCTTQAVLPPPAHPGYTCPPAAHRRTSLLHRVLIAVGGCTGITLWARTGLESLGNPSFFNYPAQSCHGSSEVLLG